MKRFETAALAVIALSTASVIAMAQTAAPGSSATGAAGSSSSSGQQLSSAECQKVWNQVNPQGKPSVSGSDVKSHVSDLKKVDTNGDKMISSQEFTSACQQGMVKQASSGSSGSTGSSSGTSGSSR